MDDKNNSKAKDYKKSIRITGMTCLNCARRVEANLQKIDGVKLASVNLATESAYIISKNLLSFEEIKEAVESAGYSVSKNIDEDLGRSGVTAIYNKTTYFIGKPEEKEEYLPYLRKGQTVVEVLKNKEKFGFIVLSDKIREDSKQAILKLKELNILPVMIK